MTVMMTLVEASNTELKNKLDSWIQAYVNHDEMILLVVNWMVRSTPLCVLLSWIKKTFDVL